MKTKLNPRIKRYADKMGIEFRIGKTPKDVKIRLDLPKKIYGAYVGQGVIFLRDEVHFKDQSNVDFMVCHEMAHAIFDYYQMKISKKMDENFANAGALLFMAILGLPVTTTMLTNVVRYTRSKKMFLNWKGPR